MLAATTVMVAWQQRFLREQFGPQLAYIFDRLGQQLQLALGDLVVEQFVVALGHSVDNLHIARRVRFDGVLVLHVELSAG